MVKLKRNRKLAALFAILSIAWVAILFAESSQPPAKIMGEVAGLDKVAHFLAFGALSFLLCVVFLCLNARPTIPILSMPLYISVLSGAMEESYQMIVPSRAGSLFDLLADLLGALFVMVLTNRIALKIWPENN